MTAPSRSRATLRRPAQVRALAHPARVEVVEALQVLGKATVAEIAAQVGRPADGLYHHLRRLVQAGIVARLGGKAGDGRRAAVYGLVAARLEAGLEAGATRALRSAVGEAAGAVLRTVIRDVEREVGAADSKSSGRDRNLLVQRRKVRLDAAALRELNRHLDAVDRLLAGHARRTDGTFFTLTTVLTRAAEKT